MIRLNARLKAVSESYPTEFVNSADDEAVSRAPRERRLHFPPRGVVHPRFANEPVTRTEKAERGVPIAGHPAPWLPFDDETVRRV